MDKRGAVIYARVSTEEQAQNNSLGNQQKDCRQFCQRLGLEVLAVFVDTDSAKTADREQLQEMLAFCARNHKRLGAVVVWKVDRLSRNTPDYHVIKARLKKQDIRLESVNEQLEDTPTGRFVESLFVAAAQLDNDVRADRTSKGMKASLEKGQWPFQLPLGYVKQSGIVREDPQAGRLIRDAFVQIASGATKDQALNAATRKGLEASATARSHLVSSAESSAIRCTPGSCVRWVLRRQRPFPLSTDQFLTGHKRFLTVDVLERAAIAGCIRPSRCGVS